MATGINFTKRALQGLPIPDKRTEYADRGGEYSVKGLILVVGRTGGKVFYFRKKVKARAVRVRIGDFPNLSVENARTEARKLATEMLIDKVNPNVTKRDEETSEITFGEIFEDYIRFATTRGNKPLRESTVQDYRRWFELHFTNGDKAKPTAVNWQDKPLSLITPKDAISWYTRSKADSAASANTATRLAKAVVNHAIKRIRHSDQSPVFLYNPFSDVERVPEKPRTSRIQSNELPKWFDVVSSIKSETTRDYLHTLLFTGLRRRECAQLRWSEVSLKARTLTIPGERTKTGKALTLPLSDYLLSILKRRKEQYPNSQWVFSSGSAKAGYIQSPQTSIRLIRDKTGIDCSAHGLRRTFANIAADNAKVPTFQIKRLLNHSDSSDVTMKHYLNAGDIEDLRAHMQAITDAILKLGQQRQANVIDIRTAR